MSTTDKCVEQKQELLEKIKKAIFNEEGIDFTGIMLSKYSINEIKDMFEKLLEKFKVQ